MKLNKFSWHYKVYAFNSQMVAAWTMESDFHEYPWDGRTIGLCPYMRMIMLWGPLVFLCNLSPLIAGVAAYIVLPAVTIGVSSLLSVTATIVGFTIACYILNSGVKYLSARRDDINREKRKQRRIDAENDVTPPETFWSLLVSYIKSLKTKVCPVLELDDE
jgi:uncharacterized membrane-anchored protein